MGAETAPPGESPGETPATYAEQWADFSAAIARVVADLNATFAPILADLGAAITFVGTSLAEAFTGLGRAFAGARLPVLAVVLAIHGEDFVVDRMGVSRCDIRSITLTEVRLWNHRRIPLDIDRLLDYATLRGPS